MNKWQRHLYGAAVLFFEHDNDSDNDSDNDDDGDSDGDDDGDS